MTASRVRLVLLGWLIALLVVVHATLAALTDPSGLTSEEVVLVVGLGLGFTTVGTILVIRRPHEPLGRHALLIGLIAIAATALSSVASFLGGSSSALRTIGTLAALVSTQLWSSTLMASGLLLVRFPTGREPGRLPALVDVLFLVALASTAVVSFAPGPIRVGGLDGPLNPIGIDALTREAAEAIANIGLFASMAGLAVTAAVLMRRYRRSGPVVRAQIRWVGAAGALPVVLFSGLFLGPAWLWSVWFVSFALVPIAIGIAILRYRLYDIDRIISRTLSWAVVTGVLVAVFAGGVIALQTMLAPVTENNTIAVAASTLLAFALFQPIRRAVQRVVDRRFNRAGYDAQRTADAFASAIRSQLDLSQLRGALVATATLSVQPHGAGVWLRGRGRR